jgi:preprotein translocase subunit SecD
MLRNRSRLVVRIGGVYGGGLELQVRADFAGLERSTGMTLTDSEKAQILATVREILLVRANELGSATPSARLLDSDQLVLRIPGTRDINRACSIVETRGQLSFQLVDVLEQPALEGRAIRSASVAHDPVTREPVVNFVLTSSGGEVSYRLTSINVGKNLAVILDGRVRGSAKIQEPIRDQVRVAGFSGQEAQNLALVLKTGSLPVRLEIVSLQALR